MFACAITGLRPCSANSFWQKARAKKPRSSSRRSRSRMNAPFSLVSLKIPIARSAKRNVPTPPSAPSQRIGRSAPDLRLEGGNVRRGARKPRELGRAEDERRRQKRTHDVPGSAEPAHHFARNEPVEDDPPPARRDRMAQGRS